MTRFVLRRLLASIPILLGVSMLIFALIRLPPGGPVEVYAAAGGGVSPEDIARIERQLGLDQPLPIQYATWLSSMVRGDWGVSYREKRPVLHLIGERLPATLQLTVLSSLLAVGLAVLIGVLGVVQGRRVLRNVIEVLAIVGIATPTFWLGLIAIFVFSVVLGVLPAGGMFSIGAPFSLLDRAQHLVLPVLVASIYWIAAWSRYVKGSMLEVARQDYVLTARSKGLLEHVILYRHMLRNSLIPLITEIGVRIPRIFSGVVVVEIVFAWPGLGRLLMTSLLAKDYPVAMGVFICIAALVIIGNLIADILYSVVDPRIRY